MDVVVTGIGLQSCLGSLEQSWAAILAGKSGIEIKKPFSDLPSYPLGTIADSPSHRLLRHVRHKPLGRPQATRTRYKTEPAVTVGQLSLLTERIVKAAIADANLETPLQECGVTIGSSRGCQNLWEEIVRESVLREEKQRFLDRNYNWLDALPHQSAVSAAKLIQTNAPVLSPMAACATGIHAIARGYELIQTGECERVIAGAIETPITPLSLAGFERMGALATTGCYPFDRHREGLVLGEGGAVFVL